MAELTEQAKLRLITLLAQFTGPAEAARLVSEEFGVTLSRAQAWKYDPTRAGCRISPKLKAVFFEVRERWLREAANVGVAHQGHRLRALDRLAERLEQQGDYHGALRALEQAAREVGGFFLKVRPEMATVATTDTTSVTDEQRRELVVRLKLAAARVTATPAGGQRCHGH